MSRQASGYRKFQQWGRSSLAVAIGLGMALGLALFIQASTALAAPSQPATAHDPLATPVADTFPVDQLSGERERVLAAPADETDLWQSGKEGRSLTAEPPPSPQEVALRADAIRRSQDALAALGPTILLAEDFSTASGATPPAGWTNQIIDGQAGVDMWRFDNPGDRTLSPPITAPAAILESNAELGNSQDVALESPSFDASAQAYVRLDFDQYFESSPASLINEIFVEVYDGTQWQTVYSALADTPNPDRQFIDVSNHLAGVSNARVRFRYTGDFFSHYWIVDNVRVFGLDQSPTDLALAKTGPVTVTSGAPLTYTLTITNQGNVAASGVVVTDTLPTRVSFASASAPCAEGSGHTVVCTLGTMSAAQSQVITIAVTAPDLGARLVNQAMAATAIPEINLTNNVAAYGTTVIKTAQPGDRYVSTSGSDTTDCTNSNAPCRTVDFAGLNAHPGDVIHVAAGVYTEPVQIDRALTIQGTGSSQTSLSGEDIRQVLNASAPLHLMELSVVHGRTPEKGGGLFTTQPLTLTNVRFAHNYSGDQGGGFFAVQSVVLSDTQMISNVSVDRGGGAYILGALRMTGSLVEQNRCLGEVNLIFITRPCFGGGLFVSNNVDILDSRFVNNHSLIHGGGAVLGETNAHTVTLKNVEFSDNQAGRNAGGAFFHGNLVADHVLFQNNKTGVCGGGFWTNSDVTMTNSQLMQNKSGSLGGGSYLGSKWSQSRIRLTDVIYEDNHSDASGGGIFIEPNVVSVDLTHTHLRGNSARQQGGGIWSNPSIPFTMTDSVLDGNKAILGGGGGAYLQTGPNVLSGVAVLNNTAALTRTTESENDGVTESLGGGLYVAGSLILTNSQIFSNTAHLGGALYIGKPNDEAPATLINVLFGDNRAWEQGSALYVRDSSEARILHTTIAASEQMTTAAVYVEAGTVGITNTLITSHAVGIQNANGSIFQDYTLFFANGTNLSGAVAGGSHSLIGDPAFVDPSADNYRLGKGSAAIDAGIDIGVAHDLAQTVRPQGANVDIGAYEATTMPVSLYLPLVNKE